MVITGASGFLGQHVHADIAARGLDTLGVARQEGRCVDQVVRSYDELEDAALIGRPHQKCDLIHLAAEPRVGQYNANEALVRETAKLSQKLASLPWRRSVFASSSAVYKPAGAGICLDEAAKLNETVYGQTKRDGEQLFMAKGGTALRLTNLMGEGMSEETIIADILKQIPPANSDQVDVEIVLRDRSAVVDLLFVADAAGAFGNALSSESAAGKIFNIGSGGGIGAGDLADCIVTKLHKNLVRVTSQFEEKNEGIILNTNLAKAVIGWRPSMSLEAALSTFIPTAEAL